MAVTINLTAPKSLVLSSYMGCVISRILLCLRGVDQHADWNTKPWGILKRDPVALPVLSLGLVPRFSSTLLSCSVLSTALVFFFPAFYL